MSTFLLEMALDEAQIRERLAAILLEERTRRGGGNARKFPQPMMASLLGVTVRAYQDWEAGVRIPSWTNLEEIAEKLGIDVSELVGADDPSEEEREIGRKIAAARGRNAMTQAELAHAFGASASTVQRWEAGKLPPVRRLMKLAEFLGVDVNEFVESTEAAMDQAVEIARLGSELADVKRSQERMLEMLEEALGRRSRRSARASG